MKKMVEDLELTPITVSDISEFMNNMPLSKRLYFGYGKTKKGELFVLYNNKSYVWAVTFKHTDDKNKNRKLEEVLLGHVKFELNKREKNIHINIIDVEPEYQSMGIGKELLSYVESYGKATKCRTATLDCLSAFTNGIDLIFFRHDKDDFKKIEQMKENGRIIDRNMNFYLSQNYKKHSNRTPSAHYLTPMVKKNIKFRPIKIKNLFCGMKLHLIPMSFATYYLPEKTTKKINSLLSKKDKNFSYNVKGRQL